ncbi:hypothetical protein STENM327S_00708 [Streptomyces tendae]
MTFHNGEVCDARAVAFSIERLLDPATKSPIVELRFVKGVTVVDRLTVDLHTTVHDPILPAKLSLFGGVAVPPRHLAEVGDAAFADHPVGTGPFTFTSWQRDHELRMRAYDDHWNGRPAVDGLVFSPAPNASSSLAALQSGGVDLVADSPPTPPSNSRATAASPSTATPASAPPTCPSTPWNAARSRTAGCARRSITRSTCRC